VGHVEPGQGGRTLFRARSFFGVHRVVHEPAGSLHTLYHGTIVHGLQSTEPARRGEPLGYYHLKSPLAATFEALRTTHRRLRVGAVGLGAGAVAAYALPGDRWTFYEIDPDVVRIARDPGLFSYLSDCRAPVRVALGDARLALQADSDARFDLMILDAYSSDAVPVHLLTREAVRLYLDRLAPHGVMAFHVSSRHFRLAPVVARLAADAGLATRVRDDPLLDGDVERGLLGTTYVMAARSLADLGALGDDPRWREVSRPRGLAVWTDDYSSLFSVVAWR
jgi:hypothetical protein